MRALWLFLMIGLIDASLFAAPSDGVRAFDTRLIADTLAAQGIFVSPNQVELLTNIRATSVSPKLKIVSVDPWQSTHAKVRLRCQQNQDCLPFYVLVGWPTPQETEAAISQRIFPETRAIRPHTPQQQPWLVRNGDVATLIIEGEHMRVQLPVVCLANGIAGNRIRVRSTDRTRIYLAEVVGSKLLKGSI